MSVIAEYTVLSDSLALAETLQQTPEMIVEIERVVAHSKKRVTPYFWVRGPNYTEFDQAVKNDPTTQNVEKIDNFEDGTLYRAEWTQDIESIAHAYVNLGATILEATGRADQWELRIRFDDEQNVAEFGDYFREHDHAFTLTRLYHPTEPMAGGQYGLSPKQREALILALQRGYFDVPRNVSMEDLADELEVAQQSLSQRLRRAHRNMIANTLTVSHPNDVTTN